MQKTFLFFLFFISYSTFSQTSDSLDTSGTDVDTVIVYEEPVVINKTVTVYDLKPAKKRTPFMVELQAGVFNYYNFSNVCESCKTYYDSLKQETKQLPSYMLGIGLLYKSGRILTNVSMQYAWYRSRYNDGNSIQSINVAQNVNLSASVAYWFDRKGKKISCMPELSFVYSHQGKVSGQLLNKDTNRSDDINHVLSYKPDQYSIGGGLKLLYSLKQSLYFYMEPFYSFNLRSVVSSDNPYTLQRHLVGLKTGLIWGL